MRRWCKGNLQNTFSRDCTLFDRSQPIMLRILWNAVTWHYLTCSVYTPTFLLVPILAIMAGIFPIALNRVFALAFTVYFCMQQIVRARLPNAAPHGRPMHLWHLLRCTIMKAGQHTTCTLSMPMEWHGVADALA